MMRRILNLIPALLLIASTLFFLPARWAHAYSNNNLIDDTTFDNYKSMSASQIDSWLNNFPNSCISSRSGFTASEPNAYTPVSGFVDGHYQYGARASAGKIIYDLSHAYGINPEVLLTKLENEENLVTGSGGCSSWRYASAVGYNCPDSVTKNNYSYTGTNPYSAGYKDTHSLNDGSHLPTPLYYKNGSPVNSITGSCVEHNYNAGFSEQLVHATWMLSYSRHKSEGKTSWAVVTGNWNHCDDNDTCSASLNIPASYACYPWLMTQGSFKRCPTDTSAVYYDGYTTIDGKSVHMDYGATAALYTYTPHIQSFDSIFAPWFGNPTTDTSKDQVYVGDWNGDGKDSPVIRRGNTFYFDYNDDGTADYSYSWGRPTDQVIVGDWNGDGKTDIGLRRGNEFFLDYGNNGTADAHFAWGRASDQVIVGDWNGDGKTDIGLRRGNHYFFNYNNNSHTNQYLSWGRPTDQVITGDWNGDGKTDIGLKRGNQFFLDYGNNGTADKHFADWGWPRSGDIVLVGDWDGDGKTDIGLKRGNDFYFDYGNDGTTDKSIAAWGWPLLSDRVLVGDWNGDGKSSIGLKRSTNISIDSNLDGTTDISYVYKF